MYHVEDSCNMEEEEEDQGTCAKLSAILVTKRDISVATALSIHGTNNPAGTIGINRVRDKKL